MSTRAAHRQKGDFVITLWAERKGTKKKRKISGWKRAVMVGNYSTHGKERHHLLVAQAQPTKGEPGEKGERKEKTTRGVPKREGKEAKVPF